MSTGSNTDALKQVDDPFLKKIKIGDRLFHFPSKGTAEKSFEESPSAEFTLYSVIDLPDETNVVMVRVFDEKETRKNCTRTRLLAGNWWYNPEF